jgi:hypothetical protein
MADIFSSHSIDVAAPAAGAFAVTPSDVTLFDQPTRAIYVGAGGSLQVEMLWGGTVTFDGVPGGSILPIRVRRVLSGTSAGLIVGLY